MKTQQQTLASRIKISRIDNELSQQELADLAGVDRKTINRIENGHFSPSMDTYLRICKSLGVKPSQLLDRI
jgi:DNA-binding XRE family transcriptional regulator